MLKAPVSLPEFLITVQSMFLSKQRGDDSEDFYGKDNKNKHALLDGFRQTVECLEQPYFLILSPLYFDRDCSLIAL